MASMDSSLAESINAQVLTTRTSASSAREVISIPRCKTLPSMISASTRFFAQPRLIMPTFGLKAIPIPFLFISAVNVRRWAFGVFLNFRSPLIDRHVFVVLFQRLAVFSDLNRVRIENANRDTFAAKFDCAISWRNPAFECGIPMLITDGDPHISSFKWANRDAILFA